MKTQWFEKVLMNYISWMIFASRAMTKSHILRPEVVISWRHLEMWGWNWNMYVNIFEVYICVDTCLNFKPVSIHACMIIYLCNICNKYIIFIIIYMLYRLRLSIYHILIYNIFAYPSRYLATPKYPKGFFARNVIKPCVFFYWLDNNPRKF